MENASAFPTLFSSSRYVLWNDIKMDKEKRKNEIYELRRQGSTYSRIARLFDISRSRARQIYNDAKFRQEVLPTLTPMRRLLSNRTQKALIKHFGRDDILDDPRKIAELGPKQLLRICNLGRKSLMEISSAICFMGIFKDEDEWLEPNRNDKKST